MSPAFSPAGLRLDHLADGEAAHHLAGLQRIAIGLAHHPGAVGGIERQHAGAHQRLAVARHGDRRLGPLEGVGGDLALGLLGVEPLTVHVFLLVQQAKPHPEEPREARRLEAWATTRSCPSFETRARRARSSEGRGRILVVGGALLQVRHDRLELIGRADQLLLLDRFGHQAGRGIDGHRVVQDPLGRAHGVGTLVGDLLRRLQRRRARIIDQLRDEAELLGLGAVEDAAGVGELAHDVLARQMAHELRAGKIGHQAPLDLHHREARVGRGVAHVGAQHDLEAAAEGHAMDRGDHRHRQGAPQPGALLRPVGDAVGALGEIAHAGHGVAVLLHGARSLPCRGRRRRPCPRPTARRSAGPSSSRARRPPR